MTITLYANAIIGPEIYVKIYINNYECKQKVTIWELIINSTFETTKLFVHSNEVFLQLSSR